MKKHRRTPKTLGCDSGWQIKGSQYFNIYLFLKLSYAFEVEVCGEQGVGQLHSLGGLAGGSINTTLVRFSMNSPMVLPSPPLPPVFRQVSRFHSPPSAPAWSLRSGTKQRHPKQAMKPFYRQAHDQEGQDHMGCCSGPRSMGSLCCLSPHVHTQIMSTYIALVPGNFIPVISHSVRYCTDTAQAAFFFS